MQPKEVKCRGCGKAYTAETKWQKKDRLCEECVRKSILTPERVAQQIHESLYLCKTKGDVLEDICFFLDYALTQDMEVQHNVAEAIFKNLFATNFFSRRKVRRLRARKKNTFL